MERVERLRAAIDANWDAQVAWLQRLVRYPSLRGQEAECQQWLASQFEERGWQVDCYSLADVPLAKAPWHAPMVDVDPGQSYQVVATVPHLPRPQGKSLILQGHIDIVPSGPEDQWQRPPFSGDAEGDWLYGRGSQDMKMGISAIVFALDALRQTGFSPSKPIYVQTVTEEESTGNGALSTLVRGYRADACLIPEPTANRITRAHTGAVWFRLNVRGEPGHVANADQRSNAILIAYFVIETLQQLTSDLNIAAVQDPWFGALESPVKFNPGIIRGGDWASSAPSWCEIDCRIGVLPSMQVDAVKDMVVAAVRLAGQKLGLSERAAPTVTWTGFQADGYALEPGSHAEACLARAHIEVLGEPMPERIATGVNDTRYYGRYYGIPALCYGPSGEGMHAANERANLSSLKETTLILAKFIADWCGTTS